MKEIRLANKIIKTLVKDRIRHPNVLIADTLILFSRCGVLLVLYWYVYKLNGGNIKGTTFVVVAWSMFFYFCFSVLNLRQISRLMMFDVQSGAVESLFNKPVSYLFYRAWWQIGKGAYPFLVTTILGSLSMYFIIGIPSSMTIGIFLPTLILVFVFSSILSLVLYSIVGMFAFWIEDINPIFWLIDKTVMILGGSYLPIALFPNFLYKFSLYSPLGASQFVTHTVYDSWKINWHWMIGIQLIWILILGLILNYLFEKARKKISVNGG